MSLLLYILYPDWTFSLWLSVEWFNICMQMRSGESNYTNDTNTTVGTNVERFLPVFFLLKFFFCRCVTGEAVTPLRKKVRQNPIK